MLQPSLLPIFAKIDRKHCLVVGAGAVALQKIQDLLRCGAIVHVVAMEASHTVSLFAEAGKIQLSLRAFAEEDLHDKSMVILATSNSTLHQHIRTLCHERNLLVNAVDDPECCDFYFGSTLQKGALQIAISTSGQSPSTSKVIREAIESLLTKDAEEVLDKIGVVRRTLLSLDFPKDLKHDLMRPLANNILAREPDHGAPATHEAVAGAVYLVGAGPGDPSLLTEKALLLLGSADIVLYDGLISDAILQRASRKAILVPVPKRCGDKAITQEQIHALMIALAEQNLSIIRLQSGDPLVFGRAGEEMDALQKAGIPFAIVPGITSASAAATAAQVSLSDRRYASQIVYATGHHANDLCSVPTYDKQSTIAFYMAGKRLQSISESCMEKGFPPEIPCVIVENATREQQKIFHARLSELGQISTLHGPSILLIGWGMEQNCSG